MNAHPKLLPAVVAVLLAGFSLEAGATDAPSPLSGNAVTIALGKGQCARAGELVNEGVEAKDATVAFIAGRMLDEGICVHEDAELARKFFERSEVLGFRRAALEEAVQIGLAEGQAAGYEHAGTACRSSGADPEHRLSDSSLGYACTVAGLSARYLRLNLVDGVFLRPEQPIVIQFDPALGTTPSIVSAPPVAKEKEAATGSRLRHPVINLEDKLAEAWKSALATAPKPRDGAPVAGGKVTLPLDVEMVLEAALAISRDPSDAAGTPMTSQLPSLQFDHVGGAKGN